MSATLQVIGSSSAANGYILSADDEKLIIEAGCKPKEYLAALNYDLSRVAAVLVSHAHGDHARSINALQGYGLKVLAPQSVCDIYPKCKCVEHLCKYKVGNFWILPLKVPHGNCECFAYHINLPDGQTLFFATDLEELPWTVQGINHLMIEVNNCEETVLNNLCDGVDIHSRADNHLSLEKALEATRRLYSAKLSKVILLHLSNGNSDENIIKRRFKEELGIDVVIAEKGLTVDLNEDEF